MKFLRSDLAIYLLPLPAVVIAIVVTGVEFLRTRYWDVPKAVALGIPIPLAASYFLFFLNFGAVSRSDWLSFTKMFAPQAFVLALIGIWLLISFIRGREFSIISTLWIVLIVVIGHWWTVATMNAAH